MRVDSQVILKWVLIVGLVQNSFLSRWCTKGAISSFGCNVDASTLIKIQFDAPHTEPTKKKTIPISIARTFHSSDSNFAVAFMKSMKKLTLLNT